MSVEGLTTYLNRPVLLRFKDGEIVEAILLGLDSERHRDLTYGVRKIIRKGTPEPRGTKVGSTCIAPIDDLESWSGQDDR
jgi:hypothetical protein